MCDLFMRVNEENNNAGNKYCDNGKKLDLELRMKILSY